MLKHTLTPEQQELEDQKDEEAFARLAATLTLYGVEVEGLEAPKSATVPVKEQLRGFSSTEFILDEHTESQPMGGGPSPSIEESKHKAGCLGIDCDCEDKKEPWEIDKI